MNRFVRPTRPQRTETKDNRVAYVAAVVFLLLGGLVIRLAFLQTLRHEYYAEAADGQHKRQQQILPDRGKILIQDNYFSQAEKGVYPLAVNKEFATIFAVPTDIKEVELTSEKLYQFFKAKAVEKEVRDQLLRERQDRLAKELSAIPAAELSSAREAEVKAAHESLMADPVYLDFENEKREEMIKARHEAIIGELQGMLTKNNDEYEPIEKKVDPEVLKQFYIFMAERNDLVAEALDVKSDGMYLKESNEPFKLEGFSYELVPFRYYPEGSIGSHILGFTNYQNDEQRGRYGLEGFFDDELFGRYGELSSERGAGGLVIVNDRQYEKKTDGSSLVLTIDRSAQFTSCKLLNEAVERYGASGGSVIIVDPSTGAILAMCSAPDYDPNTSQAVDDIKIFNNPAVFDQYEPGSVFKAITMAAALDQEKVTPETTYVDKGQIMIPGWPKPIKNSDYETHGGHGVTNMVTVLEQSLNTGAIFAMESIGPRAFADYVTRFGFGEKTGIELEGESEGNIKSITGSRISEISAATASFGQGITVTPLQMVMSYAAIANGGELMKPYIVQEIIGPDGSRSITSPSVPRRIISERTAALLTGMLINVVENGHSQKMKIPGYYTAGKTGTAQVASATSRGYSGKHNHTFIGMVPANNPKFVILTKIDSPRALYAESTAVPLSYDITRFLLNHWQVKQDRPIEATQKK